LRDIWVAQAEHEGGVARVEIGSWLTKATLDIIGLAGSFFTFFSLHIGSFPYQVSTTNSTP
jgi:hypothetical protein